MTVLTFLPRFAPLVKSGIKSRTIRAPRKRPIVKWHDLSLRQWSGRPYNSPQIVLRESICVHVGPVHIERDMVSYGDHNGEIQVISDAEGLHRFARADGFTDWNDMVGHFGKSRGLPFDGILIEWDAP